jgi:hypothetical protein
MFLSDTYAWGSTHFTYGSLGANISATGFQPYPVSPNPCIMFHLTVSGKPEGGLTCMKITVAVCLAAGETIAALRGAIAAMDVEL